MRTAVARPPHPAPSGLQRRTPASPTQAQRTALAQPFLNVPQQAPTEHTSMTLSCTAHRHRGGLPHCAPAAGLQGAHEGVLPTHSAPLSRWVSSSCPSRSPEEDTSMSQSSSSPLSPAPCWACRSPADSAPLGCIGARPGTLGETCANSVMRRVSKQAAEPTPAAWQALLQARCNYLPRCANYLVGSLHIGRSTVPGRCTASGQQKVHRKCTADTGRRLRSPVCCRVRACGTQQGEAGSPQLACAQALYCAPKYYNAAPPQPAERQSCCRARTARRRQATRARSGAAGWPRARAPADRRSGRPPGRRSPPPQSAGSSHTAGPAHACGGGLGPPTGIPASARAHMPTYAGSKCL